MNVEVQSIPNDSSETDSLVKHEGVNPHERHRLIAHLGRSFSRRFDLQVLPSRQRGVWACGLDPKINPELERYISGQRDTLDDLPEGSMTPKRMLYDEQAAQEMSMEEITTLLYHEAGHARYTDFKLMFEGQRQAKDEGYLPTSFWLTFEGIEDPRVNTLQGEESPAIDRQMRLHQGNALRERLTEAPLTEKPLILQFAYNSIHVWLHGEPIKELEGTDVGRVTEKVRPLLEQYFQNSDIDQRRILQKQIWEIAKELEKKEIEQEEQRQMAQQRQQSQRQSGQGQQGEGQPQSGDGQPSQQTSGSGSSAEGSKQQSSSQNGQGEEQMGIPNQRGGQGTQQEQQTEQSPQGSQPENRQGRQSGDQKSFLDRLRERILGKDNDDQSNKSEQGQTESSSEPEDSKKEGEKPTPKPGREKFDLSKLSDEELQTIKDTIDQLSPEKRAELTKKARELVDEDQKDALEQELEKTMRLAKNKQTGQYEVRPQVADEKEQKQAEKDFEQAVAQVEAEEQAEWERQEAERVQQEELLRQIEKERREKLEMEKAGFDENEREKFLLYQSLEDSMYSNVRNFKQAIEKVVPRRKEPTYEGGYFSGHKFDRKELVLRAPMGDERFHMRQVEKPTGEPRLFIGLLVDNSGSMRGKKMEQARKTMIFFAKVSRDMRIPFMVAAFGDDAEVIKQFRQDFDNPVERIKPKIIDATDANAGSTNMHAGIETIIGSMNEQRRRLHDSHGLIFVITDGDANAGLVGDELRSYIEENRGRLTFKAFGLSGNQQERTRIQQGLNNYFGESNCAYPQGFEDLPDEAFRLLRVNLIQFQRYLT